MKAKFNNRITIVALIVGGLLLLGALFFPIWKIDLTAPQYPEGLSLKIWADKLGGNVETVNGLNHYIGMKKLKEEEFVEFKILPGLMMFFGISAILVGLLRRRKLLYIWMGIFILFAFASMADFYYWEYDYGHNLDPTAPIQVPGMAYQPPLIGYKQMLNFSAYSIPDTGGWMFITSGLIIFIVTIMEWKKAKKQNMKKVKTAVLAMIVPATLASCTSGVKPINYGKDNCDHCKMTIVDNKYGVEVITNKGKVFKMDDLSCAAGFISEGTVNTADIKEVYVNDYTGTGQLYEIKTVTVVRDEDLKTPMGGKMAAFISKADADKYISENGGEIIDASEAAGLK
jgi:copper chaperone NosL